MKTQLRDAWELETIFPGGSTSPEYAKFMEETNEQVAAFAQQVAVLNGQAADADALYPLFEAMQAVVVRIRNAYAFVRCLTAQNVQDREAKLQLGRVQQLNAAFNSANTLLDQSLLAIEDAAWQAILADARFREVAFNLDERRTRAKGKLPSQQEMLAGDLAVDGYHAWSGLYSTLIGRVTIPHEVDGDVKQLSVGQAQNVMFSHPERDVRARVFHEWEAAFTRDEDLFAHALNSLAGYRLQLYKHRGWDEVLAEPLDIGRMERKTLDVMWETIAQNKAPFVAYLERKARVLGLEKLSWCDYHAPLGSAESRMSYQEGAQFIVDQFAKFSEPMAEFAVKAFEGAWIEAEDRPGKGPGGFCTSFPIQQESRIFMTYDGSPGTVATLAHELGHAYHQHVMNDLPQMSQSYAMNVAETASTFAEMIVADAALRAAKTQEERIALLDNKLENAIAFFMDIHCRFLFETRFYEERKRGPVSVARLNALMEEAQQEAFCGSLSAYHPHFWASKLHFYSTGVPFYNWPYTFGYLFSAGLYARALQEGASFQEKYVALLRDTGRMRVEELAQVHLGVDLQQPDFWQAAIDLALADCAEFMKLTEPSV